MAEVFSHWLDALQRSCLCWNGGKMKPIRMIEDLTPEQEHILAVFGYKLDGGVSQRLKA